MFTIFRDTFGYTNLLCLEQEFPNPDLVQVSMLEIYNEVVKDLLNPKSFTKLGLKVRQDKTKGFYCEGLAKKNVETYAEIESVIDEGTLPKI